MKKLILGIAVSLILSSHARAEYCEDQFYKDVGNLNSEIANLMLQNNSAQKEAIERLEIVKKLEIKSDEVMDSDMPDSSKLAQIKELRAQKGEQNSIIDKLNTDARDRVLRIASLSKDAPLDLQNKAKDCAAKVAPLNQVVNYSIMALAAYISPVLTGTLLANNEKALYVDMGKVINGNIMGGPDSVPNKVKDTLNDIVGGLGIKF